MTYTCAANQHLHTSDAGKSWSSQIDIHPFGFKKPLEAYEDISSQTLINKNISNSHAKIVSLSKSIKILLVFCKYIICELVPYV